MKKVNENKVATQNDGAKKSLNKDADMKVSYFLNEKEKKNLYCRVSNGAEQVTFGLDYALDPKDWDAKKEEVDYENEYHYALWDLKRYLAKRYDELQVEGKGNVLEQLKNEILFFTKNLGMEGIAKNMFDYFNKENNLPKYDEFVLAFEKSSNLKKGDYKTETAGELIYFHTEEKSYEMDTYAGLTARLKSIIEERSYDEIYTETNENIWGEIYIDAGIEKSVFIPDMLKEWEMYWGKKYQDVYKSVGKNSHLGYLKEKSWRNFQVFIECYDSCGDIIKLAYDIDDMELYPMVVVTMMHIFDAEVCYGEYCEHEFYSSREWESIEIDEEDDSPIFYVRERDF